MAHKHNTNNQHLAKSHLVADYLLHKNIHKISKPFLFWLENLNLNLNFNCTVKIPMNLAAHFLILLLFLACCASAADPKRNGKVCHQKLKEMVNNTLVSEESDSNGLKKQFQLLLSKKNIGEGYYGTVYHVHPTGLADFDGSSVEEHCVALKQFHFHYAKEYIHEVRILKEFAKLENEHRQHLLRVYQFGRMPNRRKAYIMELGEMSLHDHFKKDGDKLNGLKIMNIAKDIALAMRDFHRVAMHLDLKPGNMMYFRASGNEMVLKTIDFGSSELLQEADELGNRANLCRNIGDHVGTPGYTSPEIRFKCEENSWEQSAESISNEHPLTLTPKSDIWSIGIMIYEAILYSSNTDLGIFYAMRGKITMEEIIYEFSYFYKYGKEKWIDERGKAIERQNKLYEIHQTEEQIMQKSRRDYVAYVFLVLKVRLEQPYLYKLVNSCLEFKPEDRPSAVGILEYLDVDIRCKLNPVNAESTPIFLEEQTVQFILEYLDKGKQKLKYNIRRMFSKKLRLQLKVIEKIKDFLKPVNRQNGTIDLRTFNNNAEQHSSHPSFCDTQNSELPKFKPMATSSVRD